MDTTNIDAVDHSSWKLIVENKFFRFHQNKIYVILSLLLYVIFGWGIRLSNPAFLLITAALVFGVHELVHVFSGGGFKKVSFNLNIKSLILFSMPKGIQTKGRRAVYILAPLVVLTVFPVIISFFCGIPGISEILINVAIINLLISPVDIINGVMVLAKPGKSLFLNSKYYPPQGSDIN